MADSCEIEIFLVVDAGGDFALGADEDSANESYDNDVGGSGLRKGYAIKLTVPLPVFEALSATIEGDAALKIVKV